MQKNGVCFPSIQDQKRRIRERFRHDLDAFATKQNVEYSGSFSNPIWTDIILMRPNMLMFIGDQWLDHIGLA